MSNGVTFAKCGVVTISVYKDENSDVCFVINQDNDYVTNVAEIIEDTLLLY